MVKQIIASCLACKNSLLIKNRDGTGARGGRGNGEAHGPRPVPGAVLRAGARHTLLAGEMGREARARIALRRGSALRGRVLLLLLLLMIRTESGEQLYILLIYFMRFGF